MAIVWNVDPDIAQGMDTRLLRIVLDGAAERIDRRDLSPVAEADIRSTIGFTYRSIGATEAAEPRPRSAALAERLS